MSVRLAMALCLGLAVGCGKPSGPVGAPEPAAAPAAAQSSDSQPAPASQDQTQALLADLTQAVRRYAVEQRRVPKSLDELVANRYLDRVPAPPAGKRFAIGKKLEVYLANR